MLVLFRLIHKSSTEMNRRIKNIAGKSELIVKIVHKYRHIKAKKKILEKRKKKERLKIIIGASGTIQKNWISTERETLDMLNPKKWLKILDKSSISCILAEHVFEHLTKEDGQKSVKTCLKFLKEGGNFRIAVPDAFHPSEEYRKCSKPGGYGAGAMDHKEFYNYQNIKKMLSQFDDYIEINFLEYYDENGVMHSKNIDEEKGIIERTIKNRRILPGTNDIYSSLILDITLKKEFN